MKNQKKKKNVYNIWYKTLFSWRTLPIRLDEGDGFIRIYDRIRYLVLFSPEKYDALRKN